MESRHRQLARGGPDTNAHGGIALIDIALAANQAISMGEVRTYRLVWLEAGDTIIGGKCEW